MACDLEYEPMVEICAACGEPTLGLGERSAGPARPPRRIGTATVGVAHLGADERALLRSLAAATGLPFELDADLLTVPVDAAGQAQDLVDRFAPADDPERLARPPGWTQPEARRLVGEVLRSSRPLASAWRRLLAQLADAVVWLTAAVVMLISGVGMVKAGSDVGALRWLGPAIGVVYGVGFVAWRGATPGKMLLGIRVVRSALSATARNRCPPHVLAALVRYLVLAGPFWYPDQPPAVRVLATALMIACIAPIVFTAQRRGLHDVLAGTVVVNVHGVDDVDEDEELDE